MKWLKEARSELGYSQRKLSSLIGTTQGNLSNWESGKRCPPLKVIIEIIDFLKQLGVHVEPEEVMRRNSKINVTQTDI